MISEIISENLSLDPTNDRYRICPNPTCRKPHMVKNRGRDYCSDRCADDHYNLLRKYRRSMFQGDYINEKLIPGFQTEQQISNNVLEKTREKNLEILNRLLVDPITENEFNIDQLIQTGYEFKAYDYRIRLYNLPDEHESYYTRVGQYKIYLIDYEKVLLVKIK